MDKRKLVFNTVEDLVADFLYYDRKEDEELPRGEIERMIKDGDITIQEILDLFQHVLIRQLT